MNSRMDIVTSPALIQSVYRSKTLSFDPFMIEFTQAMLKVSDRSMTPIKSPGFLPDHVKEIHRAMAGEHLYKMNAKALVRIVFLITGICPRRRNERL